jgi:hypothetical protein
MKALISLAPLFIKPPLDQNGPKELFKVFSQELVNYISFRSLDIDTDLDLIHDWVNQPYSQEFWNMCGPKEGLKEIYNSILSNPHGHSFMGLLGSKPICQIDVYQVLVDELSDHLSVNQDDCGMHLLMAPNIKFLRGLTKSVVTAFLKFYFSFPGAGVMYAEPDTQNHKAKKLLEYLGFAFLKEAALSYKTASIYKLTREDFTPSEL